MYLANTRALNIESFSFLIKIGSVLSAYGSRDLDRVEQVDNQPQFIAIMTSYGQSFLLPDIAIFKQNLEALESLHSKWKLYHKVMPRTLIFLSHLCCVIVFIFYRQSSVME